jgi:hypothetical protein
MVELVGKNDAIRHQPGDGGNRRLVGDEPGSEDQGSFLAVQVGERTLELDQRPVGTGNVARTAGADAEPARRLLHGGDHGRMLAHAEIIVGAPDGDLAGIVGTVAEHGARKPPGDAFEVGKHPIALFLPERIECVLEDSAVVHPHVLPAYKRAGGGPTRQTDETLLGTHPS